MAKRKDLTGMKFGKLTVVSIDEKATSRHYKWICKCECGNTVSVFGTNLNQGISQSCGCNSSRTRAYKLKDINTKHGMSRTRIYHIYHGILIRCTKPNSQNYKHYGGRGITMCDEWANSFESFVSWANSNGYNEELTLERIDNNKGYSPDNCKWIPQSEQPLNRRNNIYATINGETKTVKEWAEISGINYNTLRSRLQDFHWAEADLLKLESHYHRENH